MKAINPKIALIGVGKNNNFGHPSNEIIKRFEDLNIEIYRTDLMGEIYINIDKNEKIKIKKKINY